MVVRVLQESRPHGAIQRTRYCARSVDRKGETEVKHQIFVYGTLKKGMPNHRLIADDTASKMVFDDALVKGRLYSLGQYPAIVPGEFGFTKGEVWEVSDETLLTLDHLEGHPDFYVRQEVSLLGSWHMVWAYMLPKDRLPAHAVPMPVGNWLIR
jgi:gamma-glutamylaminecyclotransferase